MHELSIGPIQTTRLLTAIRRRFFYESFYFYTHVIAPFRLITINYS